jgi:hypothetical protein
LAEKTLRPLNDGVLVAESTMTLNRFMETVYLPYAERQKRRSTFVGYRNLWKRYIKPDGDRALREFRTFECEQMLTSIARTHDLCRSTLGHIKHFLGGAFRWCARFSEPYAGRGDSESTPCRRNARVLAGGRGSDARDSS